MIIDQDDLKVVYALCNQYRPIVFSLTAVQTRCWNK